MRTSIWGRRRLCVRVSGKFSQQYPRINRKRDVPSDEKQVCDKLHFSLLKFSLLVRVMLCKFQQLCILINFRLKSVCSASERMTLYLLRLQTLFEYICWTFSPFRSCQSRNPTIFSNASGEEGRYELLISLLAHVAGKFSVKDGKSGGRSELNNKAINQSLPSYNYCL